MKYRKQQLINLTLLILLLTHYQCLAIGYASQKTRLKSFSKFDSHEEQIPTTSYTKVRAIKDGAYQIEYENGPIQWKIKSLISIILPIPIWFPERTERVLIYENGIPVLEYRTKTDNEFIGIACNFIFPLVGTGCRFKDNQNYFSSEPKLDLKKRLDQSCESEATQNLSFELQKEFFLLNRKTLNGKYAKLISEISNIPYEVHENRYSDLIDFTLATTGLTVYQQNIIFEFQKGLNRKLKKCSFNGKLNLFGLEVTDHFPLKTLETYLRPFTKPNNSIYKNSQALELETDRFRIEVQSSHLGYVQQITIYPISKYQKSKR